MTSHRSVFGKKFRLSLVLLVTLALLVTGCVAPAPAPQAEQSGDAPAAGEEVTVVFWNVWGGTRAPLLREILDAFEEANPGIKVENVTLDGNTDTQKMLTAVAGGDVPDIYMTHTLDLSMWAELDAFLSLNEYVARDNLDLESIFYAGTLTGSTFNGQLIQLPFKFSSSMMIWYNKDLFREAGLDPDNPPKTWEELEAAAAALTKMNGDVIEQAGFSTCINCLNGPEFPFAEWLSRNGGTLLTEDMSDIAFDGPEGLETLTWMKEFMDNTVGGFDKFSAQFGTDFPENRPAFYSGKLAMHMDGPWFLDILRTEAPEMMDKVGVFLPPINGDNPDATQRYVTYGVPGYAIPKASKNPDAAWEVLKYIAMEGGCEFFLRQSRTDSPLISCVDPAVAEANPFADLFVESTQSVEIRLAPPTFSRIQQRLKEMEEAVLLGTVTPEEGLRQAAEDARAILAEQ